MAAYHSLSPNRNILKPLKTINIPRSTDKKLLILDLDETLVHSAFKPMTNSPDITLRVDISVNLINLDRVRRKLSYNLCSEASRG